MNNVRKNPDVILKSLENDSFQEKRGDLKIFFGYAAGVGKTYTMLKAAHSAKKQNIDVVVGYIEPHTRPDTMLLLEGLEQISTKKVNHNGITINEFDLDRVIKRNPKIVLVDELAHTNGNGCRHLKRYKDIEELLKLGIDVYTTVNVQHIESINDVVEDVTGIIVRERIPDYIFDNADHVELVDIEPEELIERLNMGKIYKCTQIKNALENFFSLKNLIALREISLRRCADRVNKISEKNGVLERGDYHVEDNILVCLSSSPTNAKIIRTAARMANSFKGGFTALFVETFDFEVINDEDKERLRENIKLAEQLGAKIETVYGDDIALQIAEFAKKFRISKIVLGRSSAKKSYFLGKKSLTEKLIDRAPNIDIYIIPDKLNNVNKKAKRKKEKFSFVLYDLFISIGMLIGATVVSYVFYMLNFDEANIITVYILSVLFTAILTTKREYSLISSLVSVLTFNFFFTNPQFSLNAYESGYPATFIIMFITAFTVSTLTVKIKQNAKQSAGTAYRTKILLETNQLLQKGNGKKEIIKFTAEQLTKLLQTNVIFYLNKGKGLSEPYIFYLNEEKRRKDLTNDNEKAVANWVFENNKHAGATTNTLSSAKCLYLAIRVNQKVYGVVGIYIDENPLDSFEHSILLAILGECALALENDTVIKEREEAAILAKNEQLRANLLSSISHDLRTPLTSISGNAAILLLNDQILDKEKNKELYNDIYDESIWLIHLVENLLSVTRIENGTMEITKTTELIDEVVIEALRHVNKKKFEHEIIVKQTEDFILARMDARLIIQVIINIVDNAIKYTHQNSKIVITTTKRNGKVIVDIADDGEGISDDAKVKIFDMFYTENIKIADSRRSMGLGLALCKSIIIAHGGEIFVENNKPKGTIFRFTLPAEEVILNG